MKPSHFFSPDVNLTVEADYINSPDWLVYRYETPVLGRFSRQQRGAALGSVLGLSPGRSREEAG